MVIRLPGPDGRSLIVKLWDRPDIKGTIRRALHISSAMYEWRSLRMLHRAGIKVPTPVAFMNLPRQARQFTEALVMEDLGECRGAVDYLKSLVAAGDEQAIDAFEAQVIDTTAAMIRLGVFDADHGLANFVVTPADDVFRLDMEHARRLRMPFGRTNRQGRMLGLLLTSHVFAVQPDISRTLDFADRLFAAVHPSRAVRISSQKWLSRWLNLQRDSSGIDVSMQLPT
jgi:hypothetical protein